MKKYSRILWAAVLCVLTMTVLIGYTAARGDLPPAWIVSASQTFRPVQIVKPDAPETESEPDKAPRQAPADALMVTVQDETGVRDRVFHLIDSSGQYLRAAAMNRLGQCVLELSPGQSYTLAAPDGVEVSFFLEDNASISAVSGSGWTDGELLHVDTEIRCSLTLLRTAGQEPLVYTLTGGTYAESRALYCPEGETMGSALFTGMPPGRYTLTCNDGSTRTVELTAGTPDVTLGLD